MCRATCVVDLCVPLYVNVYTCVCVCATIGASAEGGLHGEGS